MKYLRIFPVLLILILFVSCVEDCISTKTNNLIVEFYRSGRDTDVAYSVNILEARMDSMTLLQNEDSLQRATLQLNPIADEVKYTFSLALYSPDTIRTGDDPDDFEVRRRYTDTVSTVLNVSYQRRQRVITPECGVEQSYINVTVNQEGFDSVRVVNKDISLFNEEDVDVKLYL